MPPPSITPHPLTRADGSALSTTPLHTILAAANGPIQVQRRDELPDEAALEITIRPLSMASGGPRERWMESVVAATLRSVSLVHLHPRTLFQVTLQVLKGVPGEVEAGAGGKGGKSVMSSGVVMLPGLVNAAVLALVDAGLPLQSVVVGALAVVDGEGGVREVVEGKDLVGGKSLHAFAYNSFGEMVMAESAGEFGLEEWEQAAERAKGVCAAAVGLSGAGEKAAADGPWLKQELDEWAQEAVAWRQAT